MERLLGVSPGSVDHVAGQGLKMDLVLRARGIVFPIEWKAVGDAANVGSALRHLKQFKDAWRGERRSKFVVRIVAVPFMGETGQRLCAEAQASWIDLSGNASIDAPGLQIRMLGHRNRFASLGRPANVFASRSSRVVRALLMEPHRAFTQAQLVSASGLDKARISRIVPRLEEAGLVVRNGREIGIKDPGLALEAWREAYDFDKHDVRRGHVAVRDPEEMVEKISSAARSTGLPWALTGLAAAWQMTHFAMFRLVTVYVHERAPDPWLRELGFREEPRGANLWVVRPVDDGVFVGSSPVGDLPCVHPLQAYLDLKAHPERASEAANELRKRLFAGKAA